MCQAEFQHYNKQRKFCSQACYHASKPRALPKKQLTLRLAKPPRVANPKVIRSVVVQCERCGTEFSKFPSMTKRFCSYECHLASGGAQRAGSAAVEARLKYGAKKDANHDEVVQALERAGASVIDMSHVGRGFPDLICGFRGITLLMEIKNPKTAYGRRGFNVNQRRWQENWRGGPVALVDSAEAALRALGVLA